MKAIASPSKGEAPGAHPNDGGCRGNEAGVEVRPLAPLAVAIALHLAVLAIVASTPATLPSASGPLPARPPFVEVDLIPAEPEGARPDEPLPSGSSASASVAGREARLDGAAAKVAPPSALSEKAGPSPAEDAPTSPEPAGGWSFSPTAATPAATLDLHAAVTPELVAPPSATSSLPPGASTTGGVAEGLVARDVEMGLGRGGPVLSAAEDAARASNDLVEGSATFDVSVFNDGAVVAQLKGASANAAAWARVADALGRSLDPRRVRLPAGGRGWRVVVMVDAQQKLADGRDVRSLHGLRGSITPSALQAQIEGKPGARGSATGPGGPDHADAEGGPPPVGGYVGRGPPNGAGAALQGIAARVMPTPTLSVSGKVCSASLTVTPLGVGLGGGCSFENIGTAATRVVSGRIVSESAL